MSTGDIQFFTDGPFGNPGTRRYAVGTTAAGASINPGEPILKALAGTNVSALATNKPVVATDFLAGISESFSTETATAAGVVDVYNNIFGENVSFLIAPNVAATWNTQTKYDQLVGARVLLDKTAGAYTILATDGATSGCVIEPLDILKHPGLVRFSFRRGCSYLT